MFSVMENKMKQKGERGSMMMEYVIVVSAISVAVLVFMNWSFYNIATGFGPLGQEIVAFFQRLQGGLSLPIP